MKLIKNGEIVPINWTFIDTSEQLLIEQNPIVTAEFLLKSAAEQLDTHNLGVLIKSGDQLDDLIPYLSKIDLIVIEFSSFSNGTGFSTAYRLRNSLGYEGEIWTSGYLIADQYAQAQQCGIDAVLIDDLLLKRQPIEQWQEALADAPVPYRYENQMGHQYHESKKNFKNPIGANDNVDKEIIELNNRFFNRPTKELLRFVLNGQKFGRVALVSSFGTQSSVLLHLAAKVDPQVQVLSIDTGKLFPQTIQFKKQLATDLKLTNIKSVKQDNSELAMRDPDSDLWNSNNSACCDLRKVEPLKNELRHFDSWISGRKVFQGGMRTSLELFEKSGNHIKINPLANWSQEQIEAYIERFKLPVHPLVSEGYSSVGCLPCTSKIGENQSSREGRWSGTEKTECGIHLINDITANNDTDTQQQAG